MSFRPTADVLEDRKLMSFGGGNIDYNIPRYPSTSPGLNFTSNSFHQINATVPKVTSAILQNPANTNAQLAAYVAHIPNGQSSLLPILEADVATFQHGGNTVTAAQASTAVTSVYAFMLHREPGPAELNAGTQALQTGATVTQVIDVLARSNEFIQDNITPGAPFNSNQVQYVTALYLNVLGRAPELTGLTAWVNGINYGGLSLEQVADGIVFSQEAASSSISLPHVTAIPASNTAYYFGSVAPNGSIFGNFPGTSPSAQLENLIQQDTLAYLGNGIGSRFNILKSGVGWASDNLLTYNGRV